MRINRSLHTRTNIGWCSASWELSDMCIPSPFLICFTDTMHWIHTELPITKDSKGDYQHAQILNQKTTISRLQNTLSSLQIESRCSWRPHEESTGHLEAYQIWAPAAWRRHVETGRAWVNAERVRNSSSWKTWATAHCSMYGMCSVCLQSEDCSYCIVCLWFRNSKGETHQFLAWVIEKNEKFKGGGRECQESQRKYIIDIRNCQAIPFRKSTRTLYRRQREPKLSWIRGEQLYDEVMLLDDGNDMVLSVLSCQCTAWTALVVMRMTE